MPTRLAEVIKRGFSSTVGITKMNFSRADGSEYTVSEVHYVAPDDTLVLGVDRGGYTQVGPVNPATGIGGVAYSSLWSIASSKAPVFLMRSWAMNCAVK